MRRMRFLRGQAAIALSLAIPMIVGAACIGADMRALHCSSVRLQQAANAAVLSGAAYLPTNPALADSAARHKARLEGIDQNEIIYERPASDCRSITIVVERKVPYRFARLLGLSPSLVIVKAVARISSFQSACGVLPIGIQFSHYAVYRPIVLKVGGLRRAAPMVDLISDNGSAGSVHGFAALWITSGDDNGSINAKFVNFATKWRIFVYRTGFGHGDLRQF